MLQNQLTSYFICLFILFTIKSYTNYKSTKLIQINVNEVNNITWQLWRHHTTDSQQWHWCHWFENSPSCLTV